MFRVGRRICGARLCMYERVRALGKLQLPVPDANRNYFSMLIIKYQS